MQASTEIYNQKYQNQHWHSDELSPWHRQALKLLGAYPTTARVLDLGCGNGRLLKRVVERGYEAQGLEISAEAVNLCVEQGLSAETFDPDAPLPYSEQFDLCITCEVIEHVFDPYFFLKQINQTLVSGGDVIITTPNFGYYRWQLRYLMGDTPSRMQNLYHVRFFTASYMREIAQQQGFTVKRIYSPFVRAERLIDKLDNATLKTRWDAISGRWGKSLISVLQKTGTPTYDNIAQVRTQRRTP